MIVLDASVLIAFSTLFDSHHDEASRLLKENAGERLLASTVTLAEVLVRPTKAGEIERAHRFHGSLGLAFDGLDASDAELVAGICATTGLRLPDATVVHAARKHGATLATFDQRLAREARTLGVDVIGVS